MIIKRQAIGSLNYDDSRYVLPKGDYIDAMDVSTSELNGSVKLVKGNRKVAYTLPTGTCKRVGHFEDLVRNRIYYFISNSNNRHAIIEFDSTTRTSRKVFENITDSGGEDILNLNGSITSINVIHKNKTLQGLAGHITSNYLVLGLTLDERLEVVNQINGDELYFLDADGYPCAFNIDAIKWKFYSPVTRDVLDLAKDYPGEIIKAAYGHDSTRLINTVKGRLYRFRHKWFYDDGTTTVWSPISATPYPEKPLDDEFSSLPTNNNYISLSIPTGGRQVSQVAVGMQYSIGNVWSDLAIIETLDKSKFSISDNTRFTYRFYNDRTPVPVDPAEANHVFDYSPIQAGAMDILNGNSLIFGDIVEGYDTVTPSVAVSTSYRNAGALSNYSNRLSSIFYDFLPVPTNPNVIRYHIDFFGDIVPGVVITIRLRSTTGGSPFDHISTTTIAGDTYATITERLRVEGVNAGGIPFDWAASGSTLNFSVSSFANTELYEINIEVPNTINANSLTTWLPYTKRVLGIVYFDKKSRTNGVITRVPADGSRTNSFQVTIPPYSEADGQYRVPYIHVRITHQPPVWAHYYSLVITKDQSIQKPLMFLTSDVIDDGDFLYFDISGIELNKEKNSTTADVVTYQFTKGDRLKLIRRKIDGNVYDYTYDTEIISYLTDPTINTVAETGNFVKIKKATPFHDDDYSSNEFVVMLYTPGQSSSAEEEIFFEFGQTYRITNPGTSIRAHEGKNSSQNITTGTAATFDLTEGDAYFRERKTYSDEDTLQSYFVFDTSFTDNYLCRVSSIGGRAFIVDSKADQRRYNTLVRYGQAYLEGTSINEVNRFYPDDSDTYDQAYGAIMRLKARSGDMRVFQKLKVGVVPVSAEILTAADGAETLIRSTQAIGRIRYYEFEAGIGDCPESLASNNYADYFCSNIRGVICRLSIDGITPISITAKMNNFAKKELPLRGSTNKIHGVFDAAENRYVITLETSGSSAAKTLAFNERKKGFELFSYCKPEGWACLGTLLVSFKNGELWTHDNAKFTNYFGVQYRPSITLVFNDDTTIKKSFVAHATTSSAIWEAVDIHTDLEQQSELREVDYRERDGRFHASFLRDSLSPKGLLRGDTLRGSYMTIKLSPKDGSVDTELSEAETTFNLSHLNKQ
jgi:hypothetical protein